MIESITLLTLCMLYLIFFRPGKTPPLENPLVIERPGQYHITLAPQLNLAQPFIEGIISQLKASGAAAEDSATQFFEVHDRQVTAHGFDSYLLAITQRNGMLFFQAAPPLSKDQAGHFAAISEFANTVLARFLADDEQSAGSADAINAAVQGVAQQRSMQVKALDA